MFLPDSIIKSYCITEKAVQLASTVNRYTFEIWPSANRREVAAAVEKVFGVTVTRVNVYHCKGKVKRNRAMRGKKGRKPNAKKAIVALKEGDKIEMI